MKKFITFVGSRFMKANIFALYGIMLVFNFAWMVSWGMMFIALGVKGYSKNVAGNPFKCSIIDLPLSWLIEEMFIRWIPMLIVVAIITKRAKSNQHHNRKTEDIVDIKKRWMLYVLVGISILYSFMHGNALNIVTHGMEFLIISGFYLRAYFRSNPAKGISKSQLIPLGFATLFHALSNAMMIF